MNSVKRKTVGSYQPVYFESVIDTYAGGGTINTTGYTNENNVILAGTMIGDKDQTGKLPIITIKDGVLSGEPVGLLRNTIDMDENPFGAVVISGVVRIAMLPQDYQDNLDLIKKALPKITFVS